MHTQCSVDCDNLGAAYCVHVSYFVLLGHPDLNKNKYTVAQTQQSSLIIRLVWLNTVIFNGVVCFVLDHFTQLVFEDTEAAG